MSAKVHRLINNASECLRRARPGEALREKGLWGWWKNPSTVKEFAISSRDFHNLWFIFTELIEEFNNLEKHHRTEIEELIEELEE